MSNLCLHTRFRVRKAKSVVLSAFRSDATSGGLSKMEVSKWTGFERQQRPRTWNPA